MIDFSKLKIGHEYDRPTLANLWGYETYNAISRGVVTPKGRKVIILFVTREKQETLTQYVDHIEQDILFWEGEAKHGSDQRITSRQDNIHVFYRDRHHTPFIYHGQAVLLAYKLFDKRPSKFTFHLVDQEVTVRDIVSEVEHSYGLGETTKQAIIKSRRGQGIYRQGSLALWKTCSVTGFSKSDILVASHIKPWKTSDNIERLDPNNSLLLVPSLDKMFDRGYIGFDVDGRIMISDAIDASNLERIGVRSDMRLRVVPSESAKYLQYHREYRFDILCER